MGLVRSLLVAAWLVLTFTVLVFEPADLTGVASPATHGNLGSTLAEIASLGHGPKGGSSAPGVPKRVLLLGASVALTLGIGLSQNASGYGFSLIDDGTLGCGVAQGAPLSVDGQTWNSITPACDGSLQDLQWPLIWANEVAQVHPSVALVELGRWEVVNRLYQGQWTNIYSTAYQDYLIGQLRLATQVIVDQGVPVDFLTSPYFQGGYPEDQYSRVNIFNDLLSQVASQFPGKVSVIDLHGYVDPGNYYAQYIDSVQVRESDGVHFTPAGGQLVGKWLWPQVQNLLANQTGSAFPSNSGYDLITSRGQSIAGGGGAWFGDAFQVPPAGSTQAVNSPYPDFITDFAPSPKGSGYWLVGANGSVYAFGQAGFFGPGTRNYAIYGSLPYHGGVSLGSQGTPVSRSTSANQPAPPPIDPPAPTGFHPGSSIVAISPTRSGNGYWLVGSNGTVYPFGDAWALVDLSQIPLQATCLGIIPPS